ncbi:MAG: VanZ family protein [Pyrinomonadaceae bacterium]
MDSVDSKTNWRAGLWAYAPIVLWLVVIFFLSSPAGAMTETSRIIGPLLEFFFPEMPFETRQIIHGFVRKAAHFTEYAILAFLAVRALSMSASGFLQKWRYILAILFVVAVASIDEFNQSFEASRTGALTDVLLDISGGVAMILLLWLLKWPRARAV